MKKYFWWIILVIVIILGIIFFSKSGNKNLDTDKEPVKIGFFAPLTGDAAPYGEPSFNAINMAAEEINNNGGIEGRKVEILSEDSKCNGKDAVSAVQKLVNIDKIDYLIGGSCSSEVLANIPFLNESNKLLITPFTSSPNIIGTGVVMIAPADTLSAPFMAKFLNKSYKNLAIITEKTDYSISLKDSLSKLFNDLGGNIVATEDFNSDTTDYRTLLKKISLTNPDVIFISAQSGSNGAKIIKQARELGIETQFTTYFLVGDEFVSEPAVEGTIIVDIPRLPSSKFYDNYVNTYGDPTYPYAAGAAYDALYLLKQAIEKVGFNTADIKNYFYTSVKDYNGVLGKYSLDSNGDIQGIDYKVWQVKDKALVDYNN